MTRSIGTSPARLFHLLTDPRMREIWGAPSDDAVMVLETEDLREGGTERHRCGPKEAPEFEIETIWYKIAEPTAACFTETLEIGGERIFTSLVTYTVIGSGKSAELKVEIAITGFVEGEDMTGDIRDGWTSGLSKLQKLAETEGAAA
jgi:uncharacterized protein YndB with AHSA1/START domain